MMQTLHLLHLEADYAHLDVTNNNIMLRKESGDKWDQLRLIDFGFAQSCSGMLCLHYQGKPCPWLVPLLEFSR